MRILVKERRVKYASCLMLFDIVVRRNLLNFEESKEEVNEKGTRFRNKVDKLKPRGNRVGNFMPMSEDDGAIYDSYAFFVIICSLGSRTRIETIMRKNIEDGNLVFFEQKDI